MASNYAKLKWCIVQDCKNTGISAPNTLFITVPKSRRKAWLEAAGRDTHKLSLKSTLYCCEDHFDLPNDMENWIKYSMMKCKIRIKDDVVPHIFAGQPNLKRAASSTDLRVDSFKRLPTVVNTSLPVFTDHEIKASARRIVPCTMTADYTSHPSTDYTRQTETLVKSDKALLVDKSVQARPKYRSKYVQCVIEKVSTTPIKNVCVDAVTSPIREFENKSTKLTRKKQLSFSNDDKFSTTTASTSTIDYSITSDENSELETEKLRMLSVRRSLLVIKRNPHFYMGVPKDSYFIVNILCEELKTPVINVLLCLKKIRLNITFLELGDDFGMSESEASRIFQKYVPLLASHLQHSIIWPDTASLIRNLPTPFRFRYSKVQSIIDCLEIRIEKPKHPVTQSLTWSEYKKCNTLKYLISYTADGLINFVSKGYSGGITDVELIEECDYLNCLPQGVEVMAEGGFKHVEQLLTTKGCKLIRPPSVNSNIKSTKEVMEAKRIARLRIHLQWVIYRIRDFKFLEPYRTLDNHLIAYADNVVTISAALINLQGSLIKLE